MQVVGATHETPVSPAAKYRRGIEGVSWVDQLLPFHASARATPPWTASLVPTATHAVAEGQESAVKPPPRDGLAML